MFVGRRVEHGIVMEPCHRQLNNAQNEEVWCGKSGKVCEYFVNEGINIIIIIKIPVLHRKYPLKVFFDKFVNRNTYRIFTKSLK